ncbi:MAG: EpsG family protein [Gloeotrichia echinulata GP01]
MNALKAFIVLVVSAIYLIGMIRQFGVDYDSYLPAFYEDSSQIPDIGFRLLMLLFSSVGLPFEMMMLFIGVLTLLSLRRVAKYFDVSFALLLVLYFLHLAVVRDFAQIRVGFALIMDLLGITLSGNLKRSTLYLAASSIHFTSILFIIPYEYFKWLVKLKSKQKQRFFSLAAWAGILIIGIFIQALAFLDPRIDIYLNWNEENFGASVGQFYILLFHIAILALAYLTRTSWLNNLQTNTLIYLHITGIIVFASFMNYSIFAFRLSNVVLSLYPVLLISLLERHLQMKNSHILAAIIYIVVGLILMSRQGSFDIVQSIQFGS